MGRKSQKMCGNIRESSGFWRERRNCLCVLMCARLLVRGQLPAEGDGEGSLAVARRPSNPQLRMPPRSGDAQGEDEGREMRRAFKRKRMMHGRKRQSREQVRAFIFCLSCHQLFKGYVLPPTHLGMRVEVEKFPMLFSTPLPLTRSPDASLSSLLSPSISTSKALVSPCQPSACTRHSAAAVQSIWFKLFGVGRGERKKKEEEKKTGHHNVQF